MKKLFSVSVGIFLLIFLTVCSNILAVTSDTLVIYANSSRTLDQIINADTTAAGQQAHSVYKLVSLDTTYIFLGQVTPRSNFTVIGVLGPDGRPPCIQPGVLNDGSIPPVLFNLTQNGMSATFKNLYIEDLSTNGSYFHPGKDILVSADNVRLTVDNVIFDYNHGNVIGYTGNWGKFYITNCKFRNGVDPRTWTDAAVVAPLWPASPAVDTIVIKYSTIFAVNAYAIVAKVPSKYVEFSHNSVVFSFLQPFFIFPVFSAKINNNIFYSVFVGGETVEEYPWWDQMFSPEKPSIIDFDTMDVVSDSVFNYADRNNPNWRMLTEAKRTVEVKNNVYYQPKAITDFWAQWNATHSGSDSLYTPTWMNSRTTNMFNDKEHWPGFIESGNIVGVDPGYGPSFVNVINGGGSYGLGLLEYFRLIRTKQSPAIGWGYQIPEISGENWIPTWPLPETEDMKYSNATVKNNSNDGLPLGDPSWFGITPSSPVVTIWQKSVATGNLPSWFNTSSQMRNFAYNKAGNNERLYVVNASKTGSVVIILDAATGDSVGVLDTTGVSGGIFPLDDIKASSDGILFGANLTTNAQTNPFKVYRWNNETDKPTAVISFADSAYRLGDHITVTGAAADNSLTIWAPASGKNYIVKFTTADKGATFSAHVLQLNDTRTTGTMPKVFLAGDNFFVSSAGVGVRKYDATGNFLGALSSTPTSVGNVAYFTGRSPEASYLLVYDYKAELVNMYDITSGLDNANLVLSTPTLGSAANLNGTGDIGLKTNGDGTLTVFLLGTNNGMGAYRLSTLVTGVEENKISSLPVSYSLSQNYPNPFNPSTNIRFSLAKSGNVSLKIYNIMGQLVMTVINNEYKSSGTYNYNINMNNFASGVYFYTLTQDNQRITKKMVLLK